MAPDNYCVDDKVAIVTGAGQGIGKAISLALAEAGADITLVARRPKSIEETAAEIQKLGRKALAIPTDVTQESQVKAMVEKTLSELGHIDILVNNVGTEISKPIVATGQKLPGWQWVEDDWNKPLTLEDWHQVIETNLTSAFICAQAVGPHLVRQKKGKVINISSIYSKIAGAYFSPYCVTKAALSMLTRCLALEWAPFNICVNAIGPGYIGTEMIAEGLAVPEIEVSVLDPTPLKRLGEPREVALMAVYLASDASDFLTGQTVYLDGGRLAGG
jgi:NAD(P)-dependent dehydrogenase (short-subunit alcohol dehydrogenase family)